MIPENYIQRVIQSARQGETAIEFRTYDTDWDSEAYLTVAGQNSNNSVRVSNAFLDCVAADGAWRLTQRTDGKIAKTLPARALWDRIGYAAWASADPGLQFDTTINDWHTCPESGRINASNPCSEYNFLDDTACNLASLNLMAFRRADGTAGGGFDADAFAHAVRLWTIVLEISVMMAQFPSAEIARRSYAFRTLGLGYANLGGLLMAMGIAYDSAAGAGARGGGHRAVDRCELCRLGRDGGRPRPRAARRFPRLCREPRGDAARHPQPPPRRPRRQRRHTRPCRSRRWRSTPPTAPMRDWSRRRATAGTRHWRSANGTAFATPRRR